MKVELILIDKDMVIHLNAMSSAVILSLKTFIFLSLIVLKFNSSTRIIGLFSNS